MKKGTLYIYLSTLLAVLAISIFVVVDFFNRGSITFTNFGLPEGPTVTIDDPYIGSTNPDARIVLYSNFTCTNCERFQATAMNILPDYNATLIFKALPNDTLHPESTASVKASYCANEQGRFFDYGQALFEAGRDNFNAELYRELAEQLGLNTNSFERCLNSNEMDEVISASVEDAERIGVNAPPTLYIGDTRFAAGRVSEQDLRDYLDQLNELDL